MLNGPPSDPDPPCDSMPPLIVAKWICRLAGSEAWTPPVIAPLSPGFSSLPRTNVAPDSTKSPPRIVTGPSLVHVASSGTTTLWYVPAGRSPVHVVVLGLAPATAGKLTSSRAPNADASMARRENLITDLLSSRPDPVNMPNPARPRFRRRTDSGGDQA